MITYPWDPPTENYSGQGSGGLPGAWTTHGGSVAGARVMSPKIQIAQNWQSGKGLGNCSMKFIWVAQIPVILELTNAAYQFLAEYYDVFLLDPAQLGCTHSTEQTVRVTDDTPW